MAEYIECEALTIENLKKYMTVMEVLNIKILMMNGNLRRIMKYE